MKQLVVCLVFFCSASILFAQNQNKTDSLLAALKQSTGDTTRLDILVKLSGSYVNKSENENARKYANQAIIFANTLLSESSAQNSSVYANKCNELKAGAIQWIGSSYQSEGNHSEALKKYNEALKLFESIGFKKGIANSYGNIGALFEEQNNYPEALRYDSMSLAMKQEINDSNGVATSFLNFGELYRNQNNYPEALNNYFKALKIFEVTGNTKSMGMCHNNIGLVYAQLSNHEEAIKNFSEAQKAFEEVGFRRGVAVSNENIGLIYSQLGNYPEALKYYTTGLKIKQEINDQYGIALSLQNIALVYEAEKKHDEALKNNAEALKIFEQLGNKQGIVAIYVNIAEVYFGMGKYSDALEWFNKALIPAKEINYNEAIKETYSFMSRMYVKLNDYKKALEYHTLYTAVKDTLLNESNSKQMTEMKTKYETEKKDNQIQLLNKDKEIQRTEIKRQTLMKNSFLAGFAVVLLFAGIFFTQRNKIKKGKKLSDELLLNILPEEVAEELKQKGNAEAKQFDEVTVMFTDFKNFTQISEKLLPSELVAEIHTCFKAFDNIISKHNIEKIKTIGDSYMCAGGLPVTNTTNAGDIVKAAIEIQQFMQKHLQQRKSEGKEPFEIRIGVHTGSVVAGIVGIKKFAYDIWGDTVNIASRMESSGEAGKVNISGSTYQLVKDKFNCIPRGKIEAKNKGMIDMYFVEEKNSLL